MFSFKQLEYYIASEVIYHIRYYNGNKQRYSLTDRRERQGEGWNANFCRLSHTAGLTVWHVWWMVLHWYCWPLTSTHCHQSRDKEEEKSWGGKKTSCSTSSRCFLSSPHTQTHAHTCRRSLFPTQMHWYQHQSAHIQMHTHSCYHTLITCILLQYVFAEQSLFLSGCLTSFRSLQTVSTNAWCNNYNHMKARASGITQKNRYSTTNCIFATHPIAGENE